MQKDRIVLINKPPHGEPLITLLNPRVGTLFDIDGQTYEVLRGGCGNCPDDYARAVETPRFASDLKCEYFDRYDHGFYLRLVPVNDGSRG